VVTPHASFLALRFAPRQAMDNLARLQQAFPVHSEYGFMDSVDVSNGIVSDRLLIIDPGMIMAAIANALADDAIRHAFSDGPVERAIRPLVELEEFTVGEDAPNLRGHRAARAVERSHRLRLGIIYTNRCGFGWISIGFAPIIPDDPRSLREIDSISIFTGVADGPGKAHAMVPPGVAVDRQRDPGHHAGCARPVLPLPVATSRRIVAGSVGFP
jgi:hypothetical protein